MNRIEDLVYRLIRDGGVASSIWSSYMTRAGADNRLHYRNPAGCFMNLGLRAIMVNDYEAMVQWFHKMRLIDDEQLERFLVMVTLKMAGG